MAGRDNSLGPKMSEFQRSYNSMSGADIKAVFGGVTFTELQALSYSIQREKAGIWTLGSVNPRSFSRGKRAIAGTFIAINFDRNALLDLFDYSGGKFYSDTDDIRPDWKNPTDINTFNMYAAGIGGQDGFVDPESWAKVMQSTTNAEAATGTGVFPTAATRPAFQESTLSTPFSDQKIAKAWHADQVMPFNVAVAAANEYGASAAMKIYGVEVLNETSGFSVDDMVIETHWTFVAREIGPWQPSLQSQTNADALYNENGVAAHP